MRMVELLTDLQLALKTVVENRIAFHLGMRDLDGDLLSGAQVGAAKNGGHAAAGGHAVDAVVIELIAGMQ